MSLTILRINKIYLKFYHSVYMKYLGMIPCMFGSSMIPSMVWVFPLEVWPYAKMVPLYPESTSARPNFKITAVQDTLI